MIEKTIASVEIMDAPNDELTVTLRGSSAAIIKALTQEPTHRCECGQDVPVTPETAYEFGWRCACSRAGVISWFHGAAPPTWQESAPQQAAFRFG